MKNLDDVINIFIGEENDKDLRSAFDGPKRHNYGTGIDILVVQFYGNTIKSGNKLFMREINQNKIQTHL